MRNARSGIRVSLPVCLLIAACGLLARGSLSPGLSQGTPPLPPPAVSVYFWPALAPAPGAAPQEKLEQIVVKEIDSAKSRISILASYLTDAKVADALLAATRVRGVSVLILLDEAQETDDDTQAVFLQNRGITVRADHRSGVDHNKVLLVDDEAITGSANLTLSGLTTSMENLLILREPTAVAAFGSYFEERWKDVKTLPYSYHGKNSVKRP